MLTLLGYVLLVLVPALGVWLASSLTAWFGGRTWLVVGSGLLLFPILPLLWEVRAAQRRARSTRVAERVLTFRDRLVLRTVTLNLLFLAALLASFPKASFSALATRGDWFLDGREGFELLSPRRSQVTVSGSLEVLLKNPRRRDLLAHRLRPEGGDQADCEVSNGPSAIVRCAFPSPGTYRVQLFSAGRPDTMHRMVGELEVQNR
jgi:hypothetical protein